MNEQDERARALAKEMLESLICEPGGFMDIEALAQRFAGQIAHALREERRRVWEEAASHMDALASKRRSTRERTRLLSLAGYYRQQAREEAP